MAGERRLTWAEGLRAVDAEIESRGFTPRYSRDAGDRVVALAKQPLAGSPRDPAQPPLGIVVSDIHAAS
jgi:hypothetical protein